MNFPASDKSQPASHRTDYSVSQSAASNSPFLPLPCRKSVAWTTSPAWLASFRDSHLKKVRHSIRRADRTLYIVNAAIHFGLQPQPASLVFFFAARVPRCSSTASRK